MFDESVYVFLCDTQSIQMAFLGKTNVSNGLVDEHILTMFDHNDLETNSVHVSVNYHCILALDAPSYSIFTRTFMTGVTCEVFVLFFFVALFAHLMIFEFVSVAMCR